MRPSVVLAVFEFVLDVLDVRTTQFALDILFEWIGSASTVLHSSTVTDTAAALDGFLNRSAFSLEPKMETIESIRAEYVVIVMCIATNLFSA